MPTEDRGNIGQVKPTGWVTAKYDFVDGKYLYNRCHLIGFQLTGENANERNLITGTRYMNVDGMLPFENMIADYVKETRNHVLYRVTPVFNGDNLVARGVQMEAWSVEDAGDGICFNVYVYNAQPGITIDYATGENWEDGQSKSEETEEGIVYILNTNSKKFHDESCSQGQSIKESNKESFTGSKQELMEQGYVPSGCCNP
jgi:DNA-entry nuclease